MKERSIINSLSRDALFWLMLRWFQRPRYEDFTDVELEIYHSVEKEVFKRLRIGDKSRRIEFEEEITEFFKKLYFELTKIEGEPENGQQSASKKPYET